MEYIRYYSTMILWASPFALSGIIGKYDGEFPSKIARTLFHPNNISYVGRMIIRPSNESGRSGTIDIYVRCFPDSCHAGHIFIPQAPTLFYEKTPEHLTIYCKGLILLKDDLIQFLGSFFIF